MGQRGKNFRYRLTASHLLFSCLIIALVSWLVFKQWYPEPYRSLTGGLKLFAVIIAVDLVCGPLFTLILANPKKSNRELLLDLSLIALIQLSALGYGLYSAKMARPAVISFERDRMAVITETEIDLADLKNAPEGLKSLPLSGRLQVGIRRAQNEKEFFESVNLSLDGIEPSLRPSWWLPYEQVVPEVKEKMSPVSDINLNKLNNDQRLVLENAVSKTNLPADQLFYLPLVSKYTQDWIVLMDKETNFVGYANLNGFDLQEPRK